MSDLVVDCSAFVHALTDTEAAHLLGRIDSAVAHAPALLVAEVGNAMRRLAAAGKISGDRGLEVVAAAGEAVLLHPHPPLTRLAWSLRHNLSFYDALYVSLASALDVPLLTADKRLAGAPDLPCAVETV